MVNSVDDKPVVIAWPPVGEVYVEGYSRLVTGFPMSKILLHTFVPPTPGIESEGRRAVCALVMPTIAAIEMAKGILAAVKHAEPQMIENAAKQAEMLKGYLENVTGEIPPGASFI